MTCSYEKSRNIKILQRGTFVMADTVGDLK